MIHIAAAVVVAALVAALLVALVVALVVVTSCTKYIEVGTRDFHTFVCFFVKSIKFVFVFF